MRLYVMRHGDADFYAKKDFDRQLTDQGRRRVSAVIAELLAREKSFSIDAIIASPLVRARQTSEIFLADIQRLLSSQDGSRLEKMDIEIAEELAPEGRIEKALAKLYDRFQSYPNGNIAIFTHQPFVSQFVNWLVGGNRHDISLDTASLAVLDFEVLAQGCCDLKFMLHADNCISEAEH